jgi:hypothetical protein
VTSLRAPPLPRRVAWTSPDCDPVPGVKLRRFAIVPI